MTPPTQIPETIDCGAVKVIDYNTKKPIEGAKVVIVCDEPFVNEEDTTDEDGMVYVDLHEMKGDAGFQVKVYGGDGLPHTNLRYSLDAKVYHLPIAEETLILEC